MSNYKKLSQLIADNKSELCNKIEGLALPSDAEKIKSLCVEYVGRLTRKDAEYMSQLSLLEQDFLSPLLKIVDGIYNSDVELSQKISTVLSKKSNHKCQSKEKTEKSITSEYWPAMAGATGGAILATLFKPSSWGVILLGSVVSAFVGKTLYSMYIDKNDKVISKSQSTDFSYPEYKLTLEDSNIIVKGLEIAGECVDKVLLTYRRHLDIMKDEYEHKMASYNLDKKFIGILECYQTLLGNMDSLEPSPIVKDSIKQINNSLAVQGYKAVHYSEDIQNLFDIKKSDCSQPEEFKPAIVKISGEKEVIILKGDVVLPE